MGYGLPSKQAVNAVGGRRQARNIQAGRRLWALEGERTAQTAVTEVVTVKVREVAEVVTDHVTFTAAPDQIHAPHGWQGLEAPRGRQLAVTRNVQAGAALPSAQGGGPVPGPSGAAAHRQGQAVHPLQLPPGPAPRLPATATSPGNPGDPYVTGAAPPCSLSSSSGSLQTRSRKKAAAITAMPARTEKPA